MKPAVSLWQTEEWKHKNCLNRKNPWLKYEKHQSSNCRKLEIFHLLYNKIVFLQKIRKGKVIFDKLETRSSVAFWSLQLFFNAWSNWVRSVPRVIGSLVLMISLPQVCRRLKLSRNQRRNEEGKIGTIPWAPNHYGGIEWLWGSRKVPTMWQVLSSIQYICFRKTQFQKWGVKLASFTRCHLASLRPWWQCGL